MSKPPTILNKQIKLAPKFNKNADPEIVKAPAIHVLMSLFGMTEDTARRLVGL
jgi:hypothetical protein